MWEQRVYQNLSSFTTIASSEVQWRNKTINKTIICIQYIKIKLNQHEFNLFLRKSMDAVLISKNINV